MCIEIRPNRGTILIYNTEPAWFYTLLHYTARSQKTPGGAKVLSTSIKMWPLSDLPTSKAGKKLSKQGDIDTLPCGGLQFSSYVPDKINMW